MEDMREAARPRRSPRHPLIIAAFALPGALAGGALAVSAAERWGGGRVPVELAVFAGAFAGALLAHGLLGRLLSALLPASPVAAARVLDESWRPPDPGPARVQVVCGRDPARVALGAAALAARCLAARRRVLLLDAGRSLALHEWFGREARWGLPECLDGGLPLLGVVQAGRVPGFYFLGSGEQGTVRNWGALGRLVEDTRPHFAHVIVALDAAASPEVGAALRRAPALGWWADGPGAEKPSLAMMDRFAIALNPMGLGPVPQVTPEAIAQLLEAAAAADPEPAPRPDEPAPSPPRFTAGVPQVLESDLRVRERLRFLIWMRRVQREGRTDMGSKAPSPSPR